MNYLFAGLIVGFVLVGVFVIGFVLGCMAVWRQNKAYDSLENERYAQAMNDHWQTYIKKDNVIGIDRAKRS